MKYRLNQQSSKSSSQSLITYYTKARSLNCFSLDRHLVADLSRLDLTLQRSTDAGRRLAEAPPAAAAAILQGAKDAERLWRYVRMLVAPWSAIGKRQWFLIQLFSTFYCQFVTDNDHVITIRGVRLLRTIPRVWKVFLLFVYLTEIMLLRPQEFVDFLCSSWGCSEQQMAKSYIWS